MTVRPAHSGLAGLRLSFGLARGALLALLCGSPALAEVPAPQIESEVVARYPSGTYLENLTVAGDGAVLYTSYFAKRIEIWRPGSEARTLAELPYFPANIVPAGRGYLVLAHAAKFTDGPDALRGANRLIWINASGRVIRTLVVPDLVFGNGLAVTSSGSVLMTDSVRGAIFTVDLQTGRTSPWLTDPRLLPDHARPALPAANGLRLKGRSLYVTSSAKRSVFRIGIDTADRPKGSLKLVAETTGADDLAIARDGTIYLATHGEDIVRIRRGTIEPIINRDVDGATAVALSADEKTLYALGTGGLYEGKTGEATLVQATLKP